MKQKYTLEELAALVDTSQRTVRYYIQQGLVSRPVGEKRGAYYKQSHLEQLLEIKKWQTAGLSLERIKELLVSGPDDALVPPLRKKEVGDVSVLSHIYISDGIELQVDPLQADLSPEQLRSLIKSIISVHNKITKD